MTYLYSYHNAYVLRENENQLVTKINLTIIKGLHIKTVTLYTPKHAAEFLIHYYIKEFIDIAHLPIYEFEQKIHKLFNQPFNKTYRVN